MNTSLNAERRLADLEAAQREVADVLVIGGGVTGAGVALDAASRGMKTVLLEAHDLAFGTSRWSSKLVHGGLRYLANGDVKLAHESAVERGILMTRTAPHLTRTLPMLFPLRTNATHFVMAGMKAGHDRPARVMGRLGRWCRRGFDRHRRLRGFVKRLGRRDRR